MALRLRTVDQVQAGAHLEEVAVALGLHRTTVYGWLAKYRDSGRGERCGSPCSRAPLPPGASSSSASGLTSFCLTSGKPQFNYWRLAARALHGVTRLLQIKGIPISGLHILQIRASPNAVVAKATCLVSIQIPCA